MPRRRACRARLKAREGSRWAVAVVRAALLLGVSVLGCALVRTGASPDQATVEARAQPGSRLDRAAVAVRQGSVVTYHVSPSGSDSNPGTAALPLRTIQKAADLVNPGDAVIVGDGVYAGDDRSSAVVRITRGGTARDMVTFKAANRLMAKLDGRNGVTPDGFVFAAGVGHVRIEGFEIFGFANVGSEVTGRGSSSGIDAYAGGHDSEIVGNHIHDIGRVCTRSTNTNGQVAIFVQQPNIIIEGNLIHDIGRFSRGENGCDYVIGFSGFQTLDHGIYLNGGNPGADGALIRNNVFHNVRHGWSVQMYRGSLTNVHVLNNTFAYGNPNKSHTHIVLDALVTESWIANNIFYDPEGGRTIEASDFSGSITLANNLTTGTSITDRFIMPAGMTLVNNRLATDPLFVRAPLDFRLQPGSPAIDAGQALALVRVDFDGRARPRGAGYDLGAYER